MNRMQSATNDWAALSILAHEVGHHLSGHSLREGGSRPDLEIEADKFSGFILQKLGASINQSTAAIDMLNSTSGSSTHPNKFLRIAAIREGYYNAKGSGAPSSNNSGKPSRIGGDYYNNGVLQENYVEWKKTGQYSFEIFSQGYTFSNYQFTEFNGQGCANKLIFMNDYKQYFYLEDFDSKPISSTNIYRAKGGDKKKEYALVKVSGGYYILYNGKYIKVETAETLFNVNCRCYLNIYELTNGAKIKMEKYIYENGTNCVPLYFLID